MYLIFSLSKFIGISFCDEFLGEILNRKDFQRGFFEKITRRTQNCPACLSLHDHKINLKLFSFPNPKKHIIFPSKTAITQIYKCGAQKKFQLILTTLHIKYKFIHFYLLLLHIEIGRNDFFLLNRYKYFIIIHYFFI